MTPKERTLVAKITDEQMNMLHRIADDGDEPLARVVRRLIQTAYVERYGLEKPPKATLKHGK